MPQTFGNLVFESSYSGKHKVTFRVSHYHYDSNQPAVVIITEDGQPLLTPSVMLEYQSIDEDCIFIKGWGENDGVPKELQRLGLIGPAIKQIPTGYVTATMHKMQGPLLEAWKKHVQEMEQEG